jgi:AmmeMemoRadiSam system protein B/AmmeMemoRadiSam system protein A
MEGIRKTAYAGQFYPDSPAELKKQVEDFFTEARTKKEQNGTARGVIAPHAGYIFSGQLAADAIVQLDPDTVERVFVIASAHHHHFTGVSVYAGETYETPLGDLSIDTRTAMYLIKEHEFIDFVPDAHRNEHCIEVEIPLLKHHLKDISVVPLIIGSYNGNISKKLADTLSTFKNDKSTAFVVSSDFSHYPAYDDAQRVDEETARAIETGKPERLKEIIQQHKEAGISGLATDLCGWTSVLTLMHLFAEDNLNWKIISQANSGDSPYGGRDQVVGYVALAAFNSNNQNGFDLSDEEKKLLLEHARKSIEHKFNPQIQLQDSSELPEKLRTACGAFVTLRKDGKLRGCIGHLGEDEALADVVKKMAVSAAFHDHRFSPMTEDELNEISLEISVLTPMKRMEDISQLKPGKHGVYIKKGFNSGTFLPQVAEDTGWTKEEFLGHCARDKAGIGWDGWKTADVYLYEAIVFEED